MDTSAKILLLGQTGAGKSSFINYFLGKDVAETGIGKPITQYMTAYEVGNGRYPIKIYDTKGIEALGANDQLNEIVEYIKKQNGSEDIFNWFHTIFYCVSMANARFQDFEAEFIKNLRKELGQHIHIIITHCDYATEDTILGMRKRITTSLGDTNGIEIFEVVSVNQTKRNGKKVVQKGKDIISARVFNLLLDDIANKVSNDYARVLHSALEDVAYRTYLKFYKMIDDNVDIKGLIKLIKDEDAVNNSLDEELNKLENRFEEVTEETNKKFSSILQPLLQLYNSYWGVVTSNFVDDAMLDFGNAIIEINDEWMSVFDTDDFSWLLPTLKEKGYIDEFGDFIEPDDKEIFKWLGLIVCSVRDLLNIKKTLKNVLGEIYYHFYSSIPSESELQKKAYNRIVGIVKDYQQDVISEDDNIASQAANNLLKKLSAVSYMIFDLYANKHYHSYTDLQELYERNKSISVECVRARMGEDIVFTGFWPDAQNARELEEKELLDGELCGMVYTIGKYTIRHTANLYLDNDMTHFYERVPAKQEKVAEYRSGNIRAEDGYHIVEDISARYGDSDSEDWQHICTASAYSACVEIVDFIAACKPTPAASEQQEKLFIHKQEGWLTASFSHWYELSADGILTDNKD